MTTQQRAERLRLSLNLMYAATDIASGYALEVESLLKHNKLYRNADKQIINRIKHLTRTLVTGVDKSLNSDQLSDNFGHDSDFLREVVEIATRTKTEEDEIKLLSVMKLNVK